MKTNTIIKIIIKFLIIGYQWFAITFVTAVLIAFAIFGGEISIKINWNSWAELVRSLKK